MADRDLVPRFPLCRPHRLPELVLLLCPSHGQAMEPFNAGTAMACPHSLSHRK